MNKKSIFINKQHQLYSENDNLDGHHTSGYKRMCDCSLCFIVRPCIGPLYIWAATLSVSVKRGNATLYASHYD